VTSESKNKIKKMEDTGTSFK